MISMEERSKVINAQTCATLLKCLRTLRAVICYVVKERDQASDVIVEPMLV